MLLQKESNQRKAAPMPRPFGVPNISEKDRATKTTRLAETAFISRRRNRAILKQFSWKPPTLFQNVGAATREFSNATVCKVGRLQKDDAPEKSPCSRGGGSLIPSPQRPTQKQEGPVRVAEQRSERRRFRRGLSELCATIFPFITNRFRKASSGAAFARE